MTRESPCSSGSNDSAHTPKTLLVKASPLHDVHACACCALHSQSQQLYLFFLLQRAREAFLQFMNSFFPSAIRLLNHTAQPYQAPNCYGLLCLHHVFWVALSCSSLPRKSDNLLSVLVSVNLQRVGKNVIVLVLVHVIIKYS